MDKEHINEPIILESSAPLDDGGRKYNSIYAVSILVLTVLCLFGEGGFFSSLFAGVVLGGIIGFAIKDEVLNLQLKKLPLRKFAVQEKIPYDHVISQLQPVLLPMGMAIEKNTDGSIIITYEKIMYNLSYNEDDSFCIEWSQSVLSALFSIVSGIAIYRKVIAAMGIIGYNTQQICSGNAVETVAAGNQSPGQKSNSVFCPKCGCENSAGSAFCMKCGDPIPPVGSGNNINPGIHQPITGWHKKIGRKTAQAIKIAGLAVLAFVILSFIGDAEGKEYVNSVKDGHPELYSDISYGEAFESFFSNPEWEYFESTEGDDVVEFSGGCTYQGADVTATIQFILDYDNGTFETGAFEMNGVPQSELMTYAMITKVFDEYGKDASEHSIDIE